MKLSKYRQAIIQEQKDKAVKLYKQGLTLRQIGEIIGKSHSWVANSIKFSPEKTLQ